ncbi:TonB-dependent receptor [Vulcaniibacterium tengchongense]|uniref:Iron complex outermembrane receptor protein n=1 Tax=Vulcaniibacterium tengchongense TaxID=1273429 RepID=A0A3N4VD45_9GAMM|nr:TonB-dependent receptor [Vulcaniibacterium tengchongense]RPE80926.1 iron complex outermembrane receptor protein [Vulcaniibacterium tengchongense]
MPRRTLLASALLAASALPVHADEATDLDRVTVSASTSRIPDSEAALPNTITLIDRVQLEQQLALTQDLSQVLANLIPAFAPSRQKLSSAGESVRGRQPLYMIDGVPQSTPLRDGSRDAHTIDPAMVERIEVIHGANALQGLGASGGIINIITKRAPKGDGRFNEVAVGASSALPRRDDGAGYRGSWLYGVKQGAFDFVGGASYAKEGLYYDGEGRPIAVSNVQGDLMDSAASNLFAKAGWTFDERRRLQLTASRYELEGDGDYTAVFGDKDAGLPATSIEGRPSLAPPRNLSTTLSLDYTDKALAGGFLQAQLYWADFEGRYGSSRWTDFWGPGTGVWDDQSQNVSEKLGGKFTWSRGDIAGLPLRLTLGLDVQRDETYQELLVSGLNWVPVTTYTSYSPLLQAEYRVGPVLLTGGLRYERGELEVDDYTTLPTYGSRSVEGGKPTTEETLPNFGAVWDVTGSLKLYASYSEGYTVADIGRVLRAINRPGQRVDNLVDLQPVVADNREIGLDYDDGRWNAHLAAYWSDSDLGSVLVYDPATDSYNVSRQKTEIDGIEANVALRVTEAARIGVAYAQTDGRYDTNADGRVDSDLQGNNISPDRAIAFWEQRWSDAVSTRLQASRAFGRTFRSRTGGDVRFDGYTTVDLQASVALPVGRLNLGIENLLDEQYITYYSQTVGADDDYFSGRGRVLSASWSHRF